MKDDPTIFLDHILECIELIEKYIKGKTKEEFLKDVQLQDSVIRRIEIIGEAVKNIPIDIKGKYPDIEWRKIAGMRDVLIHEYFGIDLPMAWRVASSDIPELKRKIFVIKKELKPA